MNDEDLRDLIGLLKAQLTAVGLADLADDERYRIGEGLDMRSPSARDQLVQMLDAFDRVMAIQDRRTLEEAFDRLERSVEGPMPRSASVVGLAEEGREAPRIDLTHAPDLGPLRQEVRSLASTILEVQGGD